MSQIDAYPHPHCWDIERRDQSGIFVTSRAGALLFRVELAVGGAMIYAWDKKANREVGISVDELFDRVLTFYGKPV